MRTAGIAFAAGLGGTLSGWLVAASMGAAQVAVGAAEAQEERTEAADAGAAQPNQAGPPLTLKSTALAEGPLVELTHRTAADVGDVDVGKDAFAWVYPEWVVTGSLAGNEVVVIPRENVLRLRLNDVSEGPRQAYRQQATELQRTQAEQAEQAEGGADGERNRGAEEDPGRAGRPGDR